jgi:hypothetical protein
MLAAARLPRLSETIGEEDSVRYGVSVPNFGVGMDARAITELAREAEEAGWDGAFPMKVEGGRMVPMTPEDAREVARYVAAKRAGDGPFELVVAGETPGEDRKEGVRIVAAYEEAGVTWWIESIDPWRFGWTEGEPWPSEEMGHRARQGPPKA